MKPLALAALFAALAAPAFAGEEAADYGPLQLYQGSWIVTPAGGGKVARLENACGRIGAMFGCEQTVDGKSGGWVLFLPAGAPGKWKTQHVGPDGRAGGQAGDLTIEGGVWTFMGVEASGGGQTWWRTINRFDGPDRIHFEAAHSSDGKTWTADAAGETARVK
jgi:hypothetical protein